MSYVLAAPELMSLAAADLTQLGSKVSAAGAAAHQATTGVLAAAADEVSSAVAALFSGHGIEFQSASIQAATFRDRFVQLLNSAGANYASAEAAGASLLGLSPSVGLLGLGNVGDLNLGSGNTGSYNFGNGNLGSGNFGSGNLGSNNLGLGNLGLFNFGLGNAGYLNVGFGNGSLAQAALENKISSINFGSANLGTYNFGDANVGNLSLIHI